MPCRTSWWTCQTQLKLFWLIIYIFFIVDHLLDVCFFLFTFTSLKPLLMFLLLLLLLPFFAYCVVLTLFLSVCLSVWYVFFPYIYIYRLNYKAAALFMTPQHFIFFVLAVRFESCPNICRRVVSSVSFLWHHVGWAKTTNPRSSWSCVLTSLHRFAHNVGLVGSSGSQKC